MKNSRRRTLTWSTSAALAAWAALPGAVLVALACGVRLSHNWPEPPGAWAMQAVLWSQVLTTALIFPRLMHSNSSVVATIALAAPPLAGAAVLGASPVASILVATWLWLALWLLALSLARCLARRSRWETIMLPAVGLCAGALPVFACLSAETGVESVQTWLPGPLNGLDGSTSLHLASLASLTAPAGLIAGLLLVFFFNQCRRRKQSSLPGNNFSTS